MDSFADLMASERERITNARTALAMQQHELQEQIHALDREMNAIAAYEKAKAGKAPVRSNGATRISRRGSRREEIVNLITANPQGVSRGEMLEALGLKGDRSGEMAVSNALTAMIKNDTLTRANGKYVLSV